MMSLYAFLPSNVILSIYYWHAIFLLSFSSHFFLVFLKLWPERHMLPFFYYGISGLVKNKSEIWIKWFPVWKLFQLFWNLIIHWVLDNSHKRYQCWTKKFKMLKAIVWFCGLNNNSNRIRKKIPLNVFI